MTHRPAFVLDSFAVLAYLQEESGSAYVAQLLRQARHRSIALYMHEVNAGEVYYMLFRRRGEDIANSIYAKVRAYPIIFVDDLSSRFLLTAARLKATYPLSYADAFAVATTQLTHAKLVSGDPEFKPLVSDRRIQLAWPHP